MNITSIIAAVEQLDMAIEVTFDPTERTELIAITETLRTSLRRRGVFIGAPYDLTASKENKDNP